MTTGKILNKKWNVGARHALYRKTGDWYHQLTNFPGALFDEKGYVVFRTKEEFISCPYLRIRQDVNVPTGISSIPWYIEISKSGSTPEPKEHKSYSEGEAKSIKLTKYERNRKAREECLNYYGYSCFVCGFNFEKEYGKAAKNIIHVHHIKRLSDINRLYVVNPTDDLRPVCPNCHAVIHSRTPPYSVDEAKEMFFCRSNG